VGISENTSVLIFSYVPFGATGYAILFPCCCMY
jgi:hypothetical protein